MTLINPSPIVYQIQESVLLENDSDLENDEISDPLIPMEIYQLIRHIHDPEHPLTLEQLNVVQPHLIKIQDHLITIHFTPTIPHCSMATLIGLAIRVKLMRSLASQYKIDIFVTPGTHQSEQQVNKQLNDKERVAAALENSHLVEIVHQCLATSLDVY